MWRASVSPTNFEGANLRGADISGSLIESCNLRSANLKDVIWTSPDVEEEGVLSRCDLTGAICDVENLLGNHLILPNGEYLELFIDYGAPG